MEFFIELSLKINNHHYILAIRKSLLKVLPLIIINSFCSLTINLLLIGKHIDYTSVVYNSLFALATTLESLTPYFLVFLFSLYLHQIKEGKSNLQLGFFSVIALLLLSISFDDTSYVVAGPMNFRAIIVGIINYNLYNSIRIILHKLLKAKAKYIFNSSYFSEYLIIGTIHFLALAFLFISFARTYPHFHIDLSKGFKFENSLKSPLLYNLVFLLPWLFGINGSQLVNASYKQLYLHSKTNIEALANNSGNFHFIDESFYNLFINIGGNGATLCLIIALLLHGKRNSQKFVKFALIPSLFNINDILIFGLPIVGNLYLIIPFILVPTVFTILSFYALKFNIIPVAVTYTSWLSPTLISGFTSSRGNFRVILWQLFLVIIGTLIYSFFIKKYEQASSRSIDYNEDINFIAEVSSRFDPINSHFGSILDKHNASKELNTLLKNGKLTLFFQPIVNIKNNSVAKLEALIRIDHKKLGIIPPYFIEYFIALNRTTELDYWVIEECFKTSNNLQKNGKNYNISINISADSFIRDSFYDHLVNLSRDYNINPNDFTLELTEEICFHDLKSIKLKILKLQKFGFEIAIDDFGTGYSSLSYLLDLPANHIKIDKSFVKNIQHENGKEILKKIVELCHALKCNVIIEGVETEEEINIIKEFSVDMIQGYYFFKPNNLESILKSIDEKLIK